MSYTFHTFFRITFFLIMKCKSDTEPTHFMYVSRKTHLTAVVMNIRRYADNQWETTLTSHCGELLIPLEVLV